ncbi:hypothetical protein ACOMHN_026574 [Nucella lapillus]
MCDSLEVGLLAASQEAMIRGSITPLLKKELWLKIQSRRLSEGKEELVVPHTPSQAYQLAPLQEFSVTEIASKSQQFFSKHHLELLDKKRLLQQRQKLVAVPVAEVEVTWKELPGRFWVYGKENKLHLADYPDTCACCVVL